MKKYSIKNINYLNITDKTNNQICYGLSQEWYKDEFQIKAGCGATTAATILTYYNQSKNPKNLKISDVLPLMEELWNYLLPIKNKGLNSTKLFCDGIKKYSEDKNQTINCTYIDVNVKEKIDIENIFYYLKTEISNNRPVAFLNLCNGKEKKLDRWHWVTIFEISKENNEYFIKIFDDKKIKKINLTLWYNTITNDGGFVSFFENFL